MIRPHRSHPLWVAFLLHRVSGIGLALFLPVHFYMLSLAISSAATLDGLLRFTDLTLVKIAEFFLVFLLSVHMFGGLRLIALEFLPWTNNQKTLAATAVALAFMISTVFFLRAI